VTEDIPVPERTRAQRRLWLTVGEVIAVLGLGLAALNYWDNHHDRTLTEQQRAQERARTEAQQKAEAQKTPPFVMRGAADAEGARVTLESLDTAQAIQSQRYLFPTPVLDHAMAIDAGRPQIDLSWFEKGLHDQLKAAKKAGTDLPGGEAALPVGVVTTYVEAGVMRTDRSIYRIGYVVEHGFLGAIKLHLQGISLVQRDVKGDLKTAIDQQWKAALPIPAKG
jgi:hypothetical protein